MASEPLPEPDSEQFAALVGGGGPGLVYGLLYWRRANPPTASEISFFLQAAASDDSSADAVLRVLRNYFDIALVERGGAGRYELRGWAPGRPGSGVLPHKLAVASAGSRSCAYCVASGFPAT